MENKIEIKAMTLEEARVRAIKILDSNEKKIKEIIEVQKPTSALFGLIKKEGIFNVIVKDEENFSEIVVEKAKELVELMGLHLEVEILKETEKLIQLNLYGEDNGIIIGKKGKTLNSFEYLLNSLVRGIKVEVDVEGFKDKRADVLRDLARKMAEKSLRSDRAIKLNPMPPRERKIIHEVVNKYEELNTYSEGKDPKRYIVIKRKKVR